MTGPVLHTERLILRPWTAADRAPFAALNADPEVMRYFPSVLDRAGSDALLDRADAHFAEHGYGPWAVQPRDHDEVIGFVGLFTPTWPAWFMPCVEIGWRLARAHHGRGYATEAARASLDFAFGPAGLSEVLSFTVPANTASIGVMRKLGMRYVADFEHPRLPEGDALRPHVLYRVRASEWTG